MSVTRNIVLACTTLIFAMTGQTQVIDPGLPVISYVSFESPDLLALDKSLVISGELRIPTNNSQGTAGDSVQEGIPAVVILHGSAGLDSRGGLYAEALNTVGIATLEIDMWAARGLSGGGDRPALPTLTVPDAFSALKYLAENPNIDPNRIGILGFSWGGVITMLAATEHYTLLYGGGRAFAVHVAHYPVCWAYNIGIIDPLGQPIIFEDLTDNPVLIQIGNRDGYDDGAEPCEALAAAFSNVSVNVYPNAHHAWDRLQPALTFIDPFSHQGMGGEVEIVPNPGKAFQSGVTSRARPRH